LLAKSVCAQHGVHQDGGIRTVKINWFWLWAFSVLEMNPTHPPPVTRAVGPPDAERLVNQVIVNTYYAPASYTSQVERRWY